MHSRFTFRVLLAVLHCFTLALQTGEAVAGGNVKLENKALLADVSIDNPQFSSPIGLITLSDSCILCISKAKESDSNSGMRRKFLGYANSEKFSRALSDIVFQEFKSALLATSNFKGKINQESRTHFRLQVDGADLVYSGTGIKGMYSPNIQITAELIDAEGTVAWRRHDFVTSLNREVPDYPLQSYIDSPEVFLDAYRKAVRVVCKGVLEGL